MTITYTDVQSICNQFEKNQEKITTRKIREILGEGSLTTISQHMKKWRDHSNDDVVHVAVQPVQRVSIPRYIIGATVTFLFSTLTICLFWSQSTEIYQTLGFENKSDMAFGAILMVVGFASYHAYFPKSKLAIFCCLYAFIYEGYFVISGTINADKKDILRLEYKNHGIDLLQEKTNRAYEKYTKLDKKYKDTEDKMYQNTWYKDKIVDPSFREYDKNKIKLVEKKNSIDTKITFNQVTILKVIYRLGLVMLSMLFVHKFIAIVKKVIVR